MKKTVKIATICAGLVVGTSLIIATNLFVPKHMGRLGILGWILRL